MGEPRPPARKVGLGGGVSLSWASILGMRGVMGVSAAPLRAAGGDWCGVRVSVIGAVWKAAGVGGQRPSSGGLVEDADEIVPAPLCSSGLAMEARGHLDLVSVTTVSEGTASDLGRVTPVCGANFGEGRIRRNFGCR